MKLTALTAEEQDFASENHYVLERFLKFNKLEEMEYYDVAVMGYLLAVKKWITRPELHRWSFVTIAIQSMRAYVANERRKQDRRIKAVSLEDAIPGIDGLTLMDTITAENIRFLREGTMNIIYDAQIPTRPASEEVQALLEFLKADKCLTMCLEYDTDREAKTKREGLAYYKRKQGHTKYEVTRRKNRIYIIKTGGK